MRGSPKQARPECSTPSRSSGRRALKCATAGSRRHCQQASRVHKVWLKASMARWRLFLAPVAPLAPHGPAWRPVSAHGVDGKSFCVCVWVRRVGSFEASHIGAHSFSCQGRRETDRGPRVEPALRPHRHGLRRPLGGHPCAHMEGETSAHKTIRYRVPGCWQPRPVRVPVAFRWKYFSDVYVKIINYYYYFNYYICIYLGT